MDPRILDKRVAKRNLNKGTLSREDYDKYLAALPDMAANAEPVKEKLFGSPDEDEDINTENETSTDAAEE